MVVNRKDVISDFKVAMRSYLGARKTLSEAEEKKELILYEMGGVKGIRYDKIPSSFAGGKITDRYEALSMQYDFWDKEERRTSLLVSYVEDVLFRMEDEEIRDAMIQIYIYGKTFESESQKIYMAVSTLSKKIDREIFRAVEKRNAFTNL